MKKLASAIAKREGKKSQAKMGDIREIQKHLVDVLAEEAVAFGVGVSHHDVKCGPMTRHLLIAINKKACKLMIKHTTDESFKKSLRRNIRQLDEAAKAVT